MLSAFKGFIKPQISSVRQYATHAKRGNSHTLDGVKTLKPADSRKTFLIQSYKDLMTKNQIVLLAHHNNLTKAENANFRNQITALGGRLMILNNSLFKVYLRSENEEHPYSESASTKNKKVKHPLAPLLGGPTAAIAFPENDPSKVKQLFKVLLSAKEKLLVLGAKIDGGVYGLDQLQSYKELPNKQQLQGQLVGLLSILSGYGLTRTLENASNVLYLTLKTHEENMEEK